MVQCMIKNIEIHTGGIRILERPIMVVLNATQIVYRF